MKDWVKIYASTELYQAEMFKGLLMVNSIETVLVNKQDSAYLFGEIELYVKSENAIAAKRLIANSDKL